MNKDPRTPSGLPRYPATLKSSCAGADPDLRAAIGKSIRHHRKALNMKASQLAEMLQTSEQTVSAWETGKSFPTLPHLYHAAPLLQTTAASILARADAYLAADRIMRADAKRLAAASVDDTD